MPLPVIANVFRVTFNHDAGASGQSHNVVHFSAPGQDEAGLGGAINTALGSLAADSHLFWPLPSAWKMTNVDILALDGTSPTVNVIVSNDQQGGSSGSPVYQAAGVVSLRSVQRGPRGRGRVFIGPAAEDAMAAGVITPAGVTVWQAAWDDFRDAMATASMPLVVASYEHADSHEVEGTRCNTYVGTQRRRAKFLQG